MQARIPCMCKFLEFETRCICLNAIVTTSALLAAQTREDRSTIYADNYVSGACSWQIGPAEPLPAAGEKWSIHSNGAFKWWVERIEIWDRNIAHKGLLCEHRILEAQRTAYKSVRTVKENGTIFYARFKVPCAVHAKLHWFHAASYVCTTLVITAQHLRCATWTSSATITVTAVHDLIATY